MLSRKMLKYAAFTLILFIVICDVQRSAVLGQWFVKDKTKTKKKVKR